MEYQITFAYFDKYYVPDLKIEKPVILSGFVHKYNMINGFATSLKGRFDHILYYEKIWRREISAA